MVCHESVDESEGRRLDEQSRERSVEEVWVVGLLAGKALGTVASKAVEGDNAAWRGVDHVLELVGLGDVVVARLVKVRTCRRNVVLVLVVRSDEAVAVLSGKAANTGRGSATHRPGHEVAAVNQCTKDSKEG